LDHQDSPAPVAGRKMRLRSNDAIASSPAATPPVATPKRRALQHKHLLEVIDEQSSLDASLPRTRSRSRLSVDSEAPNSRPTTPTARVRSKRATSLVPTTESPSARRLLRRNSEPPAAVGMQQPVRKPRAGGVRSRKTSQTDQNLSASPAPADEPPLVTSELYIE